MAKRKPTGDDRPAAISAAEQKPRGKPFQPGQSGNPSGRPKAVREVVDLARRYSVTAINALVRIARESDDDRARTAAATAILDRGWGKPSQAVELTGKDGVDLFASKSTEELERAFIEQLVAEGKINESAVDKK